MFIKPLVVTIDELIERWSTHNVSQEQLLELCRQSQLELVFPADGRQIWAQINNTDDQTTLVANCRISGYVVLDKGSLGELILKGQTNDWQTISPPDLSKYPDLFEITEWVKPEIHWLLKECLGYTKIAFQDAPETLDGFCFKPVLQLKIIPPRETFPIPFTDLEPHLEQRAIELYHQGYSDMLIFDNSANGRFRLDQARITYQSIEAYEAKYAEDSPPQTHTHSPELGSLERSTLIKIIYGMAVAKYGYNPDNNRNTATGSKNGSIAADLQKLGISVSEDTIRKYLTEFR